MERRWKKSFSHLDTAIGASCESALEPHSQARILAADAAQVGASEISFASKSKASCPKNLQSWATPTTAHENRSESAKLFPIITRMIALRLELKTCFTCSFTRRSCGWGLGFR